MVPEHGVMTASLRDLTMNAAYYLDYMTTGEHLYLV